MLCPGLLMAEVLAAGGVAANPIYPPGFPREPPPPDSTFYLTGSPFDVFMVFLFNIAFNLSMFAGAFLLLAYMDETMAEKVRRRHFLTLVITVAVVITAIGAVVDFVLVSAPAEWRVPMEARVLTPDPVNWSIAVALILLSVLVPSNMLLKVPARSSLAIAALVAALNPICWLLIWHIGSDIALWTMVGSILITPFLVKGMANWNLQRSGKGILKESMAMRMAQADGEQTYRGAQLSKTYDPASGRRGGET